jgi:hypothetical protein
LHSNKVPWHPLDRRPVLKVWRREESIAPSGYHTPDSSVVKPNRYTNLNLRPYTVFTVEDKFCADALPHFTIEETLAFDVS